MPKRKFIKHKKNPTIPTLENITQWALINFPKKMSEKYKLFYDQRLQFDRLISDFIHDFELKIEKWNIAEQVLKPYKDAWNYINKQNITENEKIKSWKNLIIDQPGLFDIVYR